MPSPAPEFNPLAAVVAWILPGAGHAFILKERRRGFLIMAGILFLVISGLLIGGLTCVDHKEQRLWFFAQAMCGPISFIADWLNQGWIKNLPPRQLLLSRGLGRATEIGTLFIALAGLMNLVVMLDALHHLPRGDDRSDQVRPQGDFPQRRKGDVEEDAP